MTATLRKSSSPISAAAYGVHSGGIETGIRRIDATPRNQISPIQSGVVFLDLIMPEPDGFGMIEAPQENEERNGIPAIVVTAKDLTIDGDGEGGAEESLDREELKRLIIVPLLK
ncbi:MAG: hypothetical protein VX910_10345 [Candidatus Latescibacterota bacterium]|nr:hypothetical protein [Candidatus Latescibacterota bacterium]